MEANPRREFLRFLAYSPLIGYFATSGASATEELPGSAAEAINVFQFEAVARGKLPKPVYDFIVGGADDEKTMRANREAFDQLQLRVRRLVDVSRVDTSVRLFGEIYQTPIILAPVGLQRPMHPEGELASARGAAARKHLMIASTVSSYSIGEIADAGGRPVWFQLYPTTDREATRDLLRQAEAAGCPAVALTVDLPIIANRERAIGYIPQLLSSDPDPAGNFRGKTLPRSVGDPSLDWEFVAWLKENTKMKVLLKGIVTREDAELSIEHGADGLVVSNHGGRQEESNRGTMDCLPEVVEAVRGRLPILIDGGFRRGTDILKALALGADAICIGRPYVWGLSAFGQPGVEHVLDLLRAELVRAMQLAGTPSRREITQELVMRKRG